MFSSYGQLSNVYSSRKFVQSECHNPVQGMHTVYLLKVLRHLLSVIEKGT